MLEIVKKTSPSINRWLSSVEKDQNVDSILVSMLKNLEAAPDLSKLLVLAKDMVAAKEPRLVGLATLLIGGFDHPRAHSFLELLMSNTDARLRMVALEAAQLGGSQWGLRKCINALADREQAVRTRAQELCQSWDTLAIRGMFEDLVNKGDTASLSDAAEGLSRVAEAPLLDLVEKTFTRVDLTLKRKLARGLIRISTPEIIEWVEQWQTRLDDPDGYKVLDMAIVEMRRGPATAPGPVSATSLTGQGAPPVAGPGGHGHPPAAPGAHGGHAAHAAPAPAPARASSAGFVGSSGLGSSRGNQSSWGKMTPEQQAAMYTNPAYANSAPPPPPAAATPAAEAHGHGGGGHGAGDHGAGGHGASGHGEAGHGAGGHGASGPAAGGHAATSSSVAGGQRITARHALVAPDVQIVNPPSSIGDLIPMDLPAPDQLSGRQPAGGEPPASPLSRPVARGRDALLASVASTPEDKERIFRLLKELVTYGGSDIHVTAGKPPAIRQEGELISLDSTPISAAELTASIAAVTGARQLERYLRDGDLDMSIGVPGAGRFRVNFLKTRGAPGMVARLIPNEVPSLSDLNLPQALNSLALEPKGLLLVTGPTGAGKATTLATLVDLINSSRRGHIVTLDDPLEFIHRDRQCTITQREVGTDVRTFAEGIRFAQRMDADVILVGELTDPETIRAAFTAAGAGRLVLASSLAGSSTKAVERIVGAFPPEEQGQARINLATHLLAIITQNLMHQQKGGRVPAHEVLVATGTIKKAIRENQPQAIYSQIESGATQGMITMEQSLLKLLKAGLITREEAFSRAADPAMLSQLL